MIQKYIGNIIYETVWQTYSELEKDMFAKEIFDYYRRIGFPHFKYDKEINIKNFIKFKQNSTNIIEDNIIKQTMMGLNIAWSYFPHAWEIKYKNSKFSPMDIFNNDKMFLDAIKKRMKLGDAISDNMIRKVLCIYQKSKRVSNFRPTAAKAIYEKYGGGIVYDMSSGFGGRLLGAMASPSVKKYYGVDPSNKTYIGLQNMIKDLSSYAYGEKYNIEKIGSEFYFPPEKIDIAFTSPPYFDTELYSNENTQSYRMYPSYDDWKTNFLFKTFKNVNQSLKKDGKMIINIANTNHYPNLVNDTIELATMAGFTLKDTLKLILSQVSKKTGYKTEPVLIFELNK